MASSGSPNLKNLLRPQPTSENMHITKTLKTLVSSTTSLFDSDLAQDFEKLSIESNVKLPPSPLLDFVLVEIEISKNLEENLRKRKTEYESSYGNEIYPKKNLEKGIDDNEKKQLSGRNCFPPPISCLRKVKVGKPFKYLIYDKESESYVVEEIKNPNGSLFHASREDGRLKLYMNFSGEEQEE